MICCSTNPNLILCKHTYIIIYILFWFVFFSLGCSKELKTQLKYVTVDLPSKDRSKEEIVLIFWSHFVCRILVKHTILPKAKNNPKKQKTPMRQIFNESIHQIHFFQYSYSNKLVTHCHCYRISYAISSFLQYNFQIICTLFHFQKQPLFVKMSLQVVLIEILHFILSLSQ